MPKKIKTRCGFNLSSVLNKIILCRRFQSDACLKRLGIHCRGGRSLVKVDGLGSKWTASQYHSVLSISLTRNRATTQTVIAGIDDQMDGIIEYSSVEYV